MVYTCPQCGGQAKRQLNTGTSGLLFGVAGVLFRAAFSMKFKCAKCGAIRLGDLSSNDRTKALLGSLMCILIALGLIALVIVLVVHFS